MKKIDLKNIKVKKNFINMGSSRSVYIFHDNAIKIARNECGKQQNRIEASLSGEHPVFNDVLLCSLDFSYIIVNKAERCDYTYREHIKSEYGMSIYAISSDLYAKFSLTMGDIHNPEQWGIVNGKPKLIDYGLTEALYEKFYTEENISMRRIVTIK